MLRPGTVLQYLLVGAARLYAYRLFPRLPRSTWLGEVVTHGSPRRPTVALTFDDGPNRPATERVLDVLAARDVPATFFVIGANVRDQPETVRQIVAAGHTLGNHSYRHERADAVVDLRYRDVERAQRVIEAAVGFRPLIYRSPGGLHTPWQQRAVRHAGLRTVHWSVDPRDWQDIDSETIIERVLARLRPGAIVLLHDGIERICGADRSAMIAALPCLIDGIRARGYRLVTIDEMLAGMSTAGGGAHSSGDLTPEPTP